MTSNQEISKITTVRIAVPRFDPTFSMPILLRMAVRLAKKADKKANNPHINRFVQSK